MPCIRTSGRLFDSTVDAISPRKRAWCCELSRSPGKPRSRRDSEKSGYAYHIVNAAVFERGKKALTDPHLHTLADRLGVRHLLAPYHCSSSF